MKDFLRRLGTRILENPKTTLAGIGMILCAVLPHYSVTIGSIITGLGLIFAADSHVPPTQQP